MKERVRERNEGRNEHNLSLFSIKPNSMVCDRTQCVCVTVSASRKPSPFLPSSHCALLSHSRSLSLFLPHSFQVVLRLQVKKSMND